MTNKRLTGIVVAAILLQALSFFRPAAAGSFVYLSPRPDSRYIHPETSLAVREGRSFDPAVLDMTVFTVIGSQSGPHDGRNVLSDDRRTLLFYPDRPFDYGEEVTVTIQAGLHTADGAPVAGTSFRFSTISREPTPEERAAAAARGYPASADAGSGNGFRSYHTHPEFQGVMTATVTTPPQNTASGYLFVSATGNSSSRSVMILEESGDPVYISLAPPGEFVADLKVVRYQGQDHLAYHSGLFQGAWSIGSTYLFDNTYSLVDSWTIENGYQADFHEFQILENGHVLLLGYLPTPFDLSPYGGPSDGVLIDVVLQGQDTDKNVIFEWHGLDHFDPQDTYLPLTNPIVDYVHSNAIEVDHDGNLLLSSRNLDEITKIDWTTGEIIWRLGGAHNEFAFTNDIGFNRQHDIRRLANGNITLFDNGNAHSPSHSRAVEYAIDETAKKVTLVWKYPADTSLFAPFMGNAQRLDNGNTLIGWGAIPMFTEVLSDTTRTYEVALGDLTYRAHRFEWSAVPDAPPRAALVTAASPFTATLYASWNGATDISGYEVHAGPNTGSMSLLTTAARTGFETMIPLTGLPSDTCVFRVRPVHMDLFETPFSDPVYRIDSMTCLQLLNLQLFPFLSNE